MDTIDKQFNDYVTNKVIQLLDVTEHEYREILLDAGIKARNSNSAYKSYFTETGAFWDCYFNRINLINLQIIVEDSFYISINHNNGMVKEEDYFEAITKKFVLPRRVINLINKQYRLKFVKEAITRDLKPIKKQRQTRASKNLNNQSQINLNTI